MNFQDYLKKCLEDPNFKKEWDNLNKLDESLSNSKEQKSDKIANFIEDLYDLRKESIAKDGEYGLGNLVFKEFRNLGYLDNLKELRKQEKSKELSLEQLEQLKEENNGFKEHLPFTKEEFEKLKENNELEFEDTTHGSRIFKDGEQVGTYLEVFGELWCNNKKDLGLEENLEEEYEAKLNEQKEYILNEYRKYANLAPEDEITEANLNKHALNKLSTWENYDIHDLEELLLNK